MSHSNKIKLVYCTPSLSNPGGMERVITEKVNYLSEKNYDITIITTDNRGIKDFFVLSPQVKRIDFELNYDLHFTKNFFRQLYSHVQKQKKYKKMLQDFLFEEEIDICISTGGKEIEFLSKINTKCKKIVEIHFGKNFRKQFVQSTKKSIFWKIFAKYRTQQLIAQTKKLDTLVVLTKKDELDWKKTHKNIVQIYNPVYTEQTKEAQLTNNVAIAVGKLDPQKGFDMLIDCWKQISEKNPSWILNIWGQGELKEYLQKKIMLVNLEHKVFLKGSSSEIHKHYLDSSLLLMTSRFEGFPMVLLEALSCGLPIIAYDCEHGPSELVDNGYNGYIIPDFDESEFVEKADFLINNHDIRKSFGKNSLRKSQDFSFIKIMNQWDTLFHNLLK